MASVAASAAKTPSSSWLRKAATVEGNRSERQVEVRVAVGEAGKYRLATAVDHVGGGLTGRPVGRIDGRDAIAIDDQRRVVMDRPRRIGGHNGRVADGDPHARGV